MFAAVVPPEDVLDELEAFLEPRREAAPFRWTLPTQWHLTLAFMAHVPERGLDDLLERMTRAGRRRTPFVMGFAGGGTFPNPTRAKVLFAGVQTKPEAAEELRRLSTGARAAANRAGAEAEGGPFRPHLTLARMKRPVEATRWLRVLEGYASREFGVTDFVLIESHLGEGPSKRPRYDEVARFPLGQGG